jgi:hypothetical protein
VKCLRCLYLSCMNLSQGLNSQSVSAAGRMMSELHHMHTRVLQPTPANMHVHGHRLGVKYMYLSCVWVSDRVCVCAHTQQYQTAVCSKGMSCFFPGWLGVS